MLAAAEPPRYQPARVGSRMDAFDPVIRRVLGDSPQVNAPGMTEILREHGYEGSVDVVKRRLRELRPPGGARPNAPASAALCARAEQWPSSAGGRYWPPLGERGRWVFARDAPITWSPRTRSAP